MANSEQSETDLGGIRKAAILMRAVDKDAAALMLGRLEAKTVEEVTREIASLQDIGDELRNSVLEEFYELALVQAGARGGGLDYARALLNRSFEPGEADRILQQIKQQVRKTPFAFLQKAETQNLLTFIEDEHPQTIALIVSHLHFTQASEILGGLPSSKQVEVVKRVANMEQTNPEMIFEVERGLEARLSNQLGQPFAKIGGMETVAEMLNLVDRSTEKSIMEGLEAEDPDLLEQIRRLMFVFEDINQVDDKGIQAVLKEIDKDELSLGLKTASEELKEKIFGNMSARAVAMIKEDMEYMGPVRVADVEAAQQRIVDVVRRLEDSGEIIILDRGGEKDVLV